MHALSLIALIRSDLTPMAIPSPRCSEAVGRVALSLSVEANLSFARARHTAARDSAGGGELFLDERFSDAIRAAGLRFHSKNYEAPCRPPRTSATYERSALVLKPAARGSPAAHAGRDKAGADASRFHPQERSHMHCGGGSRHEAKRKHEYLQQRLARQCASGNGCTNCFKDQLDI